MALLPATLSAVGLTVLEHALFEWLFVGCAVALAGSAAVMGHRVHRSWSVTAGFVLGGGGLLTARGVEVLGLHGGFVLAVLGGALLVVSHVFNHVRCRNCPDATCSIG
jgi:hypothetical protein